ncbi:hypothetical protein FRC07_003922 [Ceratobasidium sp. 392]|nr:hypothetical protein FRC07_003922 [Ceratobasidium sp. 392]
MPVLVVTVLAFLAYGFSTIVPLFAQFCPYSTPVATAIVDLRKSIPLVAYSISHYLYWHISYPKWLELTLERIKDWLNPDNARREDGIETNESNRAPADITTSQMIAWMITNCEDSHSVDIALQALAGAHDGLPRAPLEQCDALSRIVSRLKQGCALFEPTLQDPSVQQLAAISTASKYLRASINCLYGSGSVPADFDRWSSYVESSMRSNLRNWDYYRLRPSCTKILTLSRHRIENAGVLAVAASMSFCHLQGPYSSRGRDGERLATAISDVLGHVTSALNSHFQEGGVALATTGLHALVKSSVHYLVGCWPREWKYRRRGSLPVLLARVFVACYDTAPDTARAAAVALVAGAFASYTYPGGREPTPNVDAREKRAVQVLQYYQANKPDTEQLFALYIFGFYSWLPWVTSDYQNEQLTGIIRDLGPITRGDHYELGAILRKQIQTMPYQFSLLEFAIKTVSTCVSSTTNNTRSRTSAITTSLLLFYTPPDFDQLHIGLYLVALVSLCHAKSDDHQNLCMQVIAKQGLPDAPLQELNSVDGKKLLQQLCCTLFSKNTAVLPFAAVHFGLLVAHIATNEQGSLEDRQSTLRPLLSLQDWSGELQDHSAVKLSDLVSHLEEIIVNHSTVNGLQRTMQFITSFCNTSLDTDLDLSPSSGAPTNWQEKLEKLKWSYQPTLEELDSLYAKYEDDFISNLPQLAEEESVLASGTTEIMTQRARQAEIVDQDTSWGFEGPFGAR